MISYKKFNKLLYELFCKPIHLATIELYPAWSRNHDDFQTIIADDFNVSTLGCCIFWHEEPLDKKLFEDIIETKPYHNGGANPHCVTIFNSANLNSLTVAWISDVNFILLSNSEKSDDKKQALKNQGILDWYFFFHGFLSLYWFEDYKYLDTSLYIDKVFICLNHLITKKRSYRLSLLAQILSKKLDQFGYISAPLLSKEVVKTELVDPDSYLSPSAKKYIYQQLYPKAKKMTLDTVNNYNDASADLVQEKFLHTAFWHIVTETVFYESKLHLTEKIFKPIASKRPFILVCSPGALKYLKSYGFRTFDNWIDESYDDENDPDIRIEKICLQLEKLCQLTKRELEQMHIEMKEILEHNYSHFFGKFKEIIVDEMIDNFKKCVFIYNKDKSERFRIYEKHLNYENIREKLLT